MDTVQLTLVGLGIVVAVLASYAPSKEFLLDGMENVITSRFVKKYMKWLVPLYIVAAYIPALNLLLTMFIIFLFVIGVIVGGVGVILFSLCLLFLEMLKGRWLVFLAHTIAKFRVKDFVEYHFPTLYDTDNDKKGD